MFSVLSQMGSLETHLVMKNNAMFLLELSGSTTRTVNPSPPDTVSAFPPPGPLQCLHALGVHPAMLRDDSHFPQEESMRRRDSDSSSQARVRFLIFFFKIKEFCMWCIFSM